MTMRMTARKTGSCLVMVPSYDRHQNVEAMKTGSSGMTIFVTMASTIFWNSSSSFAMVSPRVQTVAKPSRMASTSALMTGMI